MIVFNKPYIVGDEFNYISDAIEKGKLSGNGAYTKLCQDFFESKYGFKKTLLTTSCTDALEMCAILLNIKPGDEVIIPSFTFVSTALAFVRQGAKIIFADSNHYNPNLDVSKLEALITKKTKVIVPVHYAGISVDMDPLMSLAKKYNLYVVEDAAQAIDSYYKGKPLGSIGHLSTFSFHETKNIISGEGGLLAINDSQFINRAEVIWEKGTNRNSFFRGEINKYGWIDIGSSFLPSEITAAFLYAQLMKMDDIQNRRKYIWNKYHNFLYEIVKNVDIELPFLPEFTTNNAHMFYIVCKSLKQRTALIDFLQKNNIHAVFHYQGLHKSQYIKSNDYEINSLINSDKYTDRLLRLPLFFDLTDEDIKYILNKVKHFFTIN